MMQRLADDPSFWIAVAAVLAWVTAWAKVKAAEYEARSANGKADTVAAGQGVQQVTLVQHTAQIAALEAVTTQGPVDRGQATAMPAAAAPVPPAAAVPTVPLPSGTVPTSASVTTPPGVPMPLSSSSPATEHTTGGTLAVPANGYPPPPET